MKTVKPPETSAVTAPLALMVETSAAAPGIGVMRAATSSRCAVVRPESRATR